MIHRGDKFIFGGLILEVRKASVDDHYVYVTWEGVGSARIPLKYFLDRYISVTSMLNIDHYIRKYNLQMV